MKKLVLKNLTCPQCADKIEKQVRKLPYVHEASYNISTQTLFLESNEQYNESHALEDIGKIVNDHEEGVEVIPYNISSPHENRHGLRQYIHIFIGLVVFLSGYLYINDFFTTRWNPLLWTGYLIITHKTVIRTWKGFTSHQWFNEHLLMLTATLAAMFVEQPLEAVLVIIFYSIGEHMQQRAVNRSREEIFSLLDLHVDYANVITGNDIVTKDPLELVKGDKILIKNGERVPVDCIITKGNTYLDTSTLSGESKPRFVSQGDKILSGTINTANVIEAEVIKTYDDSAIARIIDLVENAQGNKARTERFITRFARYYTPAVMALALVFAIVPSVLNPSNTQDYVFRAATFLVISCPCALVLSVPLTYFAGVGKSASDGILFKSANTLDSMHKVDTIGFDKTGTLTHGSFTITGYTNDTTLYLAASVEQYSAHPIAKCIVNFCKQSLASFDDIEEIPGKGMIARNDNTTILVGNATLMQDYQIETPKDSGSPEETITHVANNGAYVGSITVSDSLKNDAASTVHSLAKHKKVIMFTGDNKPVARSVSKALGDIGYHHSLLPEDKVTAFNSEKQEGLAMFVGDGINDAPLLKSADIGVALSKGSELAIDVADITLRGDNLSQLEQAFLNASITRRIAIQNIVLSLGIKFAFLLLASVGLVTMLMAVFADVGITLLAVLNALRLIHPFKGRDRHAQPAS